MEELRESVKELQEKLHKATENASLVHASTLKMEESNARVIASVETLVKEVATLVERTKQVQRLDISLVKEKDKIVHLETEVALLKQRQDRTDKIVWGVISSVLAAVGLLIMKNVGIS